MVKRIRYAIEDAFNFVCDAFGWFQPDFGQFNTMVRDEDGNMVPMSQEYFDNLKAEVHERIEDFWFEKEAEAVATHGEGILRPQ